MVSRYKIGKSDLYALREFLVQEYKKDRDFFDREGYFFSQVTDNYKGSEFSLKKCKVSENYDIIKFIYDGDQISLHSKNLKNDEDKRLAKDIAYEVGKRCYRNIVRNIDDLLIK